MKVKFNQTTEFGEGPEITTPWDQLSTEKNRLLSSLINKGKASIDFEYEDSELIYAFLRQIQIDVRDAATKEAIQARNIQHMTLKSPPSTDWNNAPDIILTFPLESGDIVTRNIGNQYSTTDLGIFFDDLMIGEKKQLQTKDQKEQQINVGETLVFGRISVTRRRTDYMAYMDGDKTKWESGSSLHHAIGKLVTSHPELFS